MINPKSNSSITPSAYYEWQKALLHSGDRAIFLASNAGLLIATYGHWGHGCHPRAVDTLPRASGMSDSALGKRTGLLTSRAWLRAKRRSHSSTVYCIAPVADGAPVLSIPGPCTLCFPGGGSIVAAAGSRPSPTRDDQEALPRDSAALGTRSEPEPKGQHQTEADCHLPAVAAADLTEEAPVWRLVRLLNELRPQITAGELQIFKAVMESYITDRRLVDLEAATKAMATKVTAPAITAKIVKAFVEVQFPVRVRPPSKKEQRRLREEKFLAALEAEQRDRQVILAWEADRDDERSAYWQRRAAMCAWALLPEVVQEWRAEGRGGVG